MVNMVSLDTILVEFVTRQKIEEFITNDNVIGEPKRVQNPRVHRKFRIISVRHEVALDKCETVSRKKSHSNLRLVKFHL